MVITRRRMLRVAGTAMSGSVVAGCVSNDVPADDEETDPNGTGSPGDDPDEDGDVDDMSIDGRLHNESEKSETFAVTIRNPNGAEIASDEWEVGAGETKPVPAFGKPGESRTFEATVAGVTETETFEFDVKTEPGKRAGYVEITYTQDGTVEIVFTPVRDGVAGLARIEEPPYEIEEPECGDLGDRDPLWLCENMPAEPSVVFDQVETTSQVFVDEGLGVDAEMEGDHQFYAVLLTREEELDRVSDNIGGNVADLIEGTDFAAEALLVAQTGWGSGTVTPHLKRIEETDAGIHAFGCYRRPCGGTDDITMRTAVARFKQSETLDEAVVSLTVDPQYSVSFEAGEGVVTIDGL